MGGVDDRCHFCLAYAAAPRRKGTVEIDIGRILGRVTMERCLRVRVDPLRARVVGANADLTRPSATLNDTRVRFQPTPASEARAVRAGFFSCRLDECERQRQTNSGGTARGHRPALTSPVTCVAVLPGAHC